MRTLPQVDTPRIGIYGGSSGGFLTALALGRNSDLFATGVDIHGVHDFTAGGSGSGAAVQAALAAPGRAAPADRERAAETAWTSSPVASVGTWKSPVLLIHGDEDRNVRFSQTVDLTRRLDAAKVPYRGDRDSRRHPSLDAARQRPPRLQSGRGVVRTPPVRG